MWRRLGIVVFRSSGPLILVVVGLAEEATFIREDLFMDLPNEAAATLQVAAELVDELVEA